MPHTSAEASRRTSYFKAINTPVGAVDGQLKGRAFGPHPAIAMWATTANALRAIAKHTSPSLSPATLIRKRLQSLRSAWFGIPPPLATSTDSNNPNTDLGVATATILLLDKRWQSPW